MTTTTLTGQQQAAAVLSRILATPGLPEATWRVYPPRLSSGMPKLTGQLFSANTADTRAAIDAYALAFGLDLEDEKYVAGGDYCPAFTEVSTSGLIDGVSVRIWGSAR